MEQFAELAGIEPNDLLLFARVAELGSLSRAAARMGWPKSTVSRRLAQLERRLGERLLLRTTRRQTLTEFGQLLLEHARVVASEVEAVALLGEQRRAEPSGRLRVSMPADFANLLLADSLAAFVALHPRLSLELDLSPRRVDLLAEGFDLAVRMGELPDDAYLAARALARFSNGLYASPDYLAEHGEPRHPDELAGHAAVHLLTRQGTGMPWLLQQGGNIWQGLPPGRASANSPELLLRLARAGTGIAGLPDPFAQASVQRGLLRRVLPGWSLPLHTAWAVFPGRNPMPARTRAFVDMLLAALGPLRAGAAPGAWPGA
ncbi:MAG: LysR family transcriptional regulator [Betaproteobacteria bacterium]|nr:LysR family transcriptional regulator [Betaproteobacteria bacterium]MBU6511154.1 LysR family transcriptional regulator [Betaproteobacteria bacterium]MDE1954979.1 LysR family transcriptional regulator [Betaproteobacteria bacterium]MDE2150857.1 LysR family transcriptional regulator [Betaproteobacteria bacterium]MDE2478167.1 LysR family transcriptional regulator [Betaproteobacteria bacterium]